MDSTDVILAFLRNNSAPDFAKILYNVPVLYAALNNPNLSMILAPSDATLQRLVNESGKSLSQLQQDRYGVDIFANHLSTSPTKRVWPMITSINDLKYGSSEADILALEAQATTIIGKTVVLIINRIILHGDQLARASLQRTAGPFEILKADRGFKVMIDQGYIKGYELVKLCSSNPEVGSLCDNLNFDLLLRRDYSSQPLSKAIVGKSARDLYFKHALGYRVVTNMIDSDVGRFKTIDVPEGVIDVKVGLNFLAMLTVNGKVFLNGRMRSINQDIRLKEMNFGHRKPFEVTGIPPITKISVGENGLRMIDQDGRLWVYGSLQAVMFTVKYYAVAESDSTSVLNALRYSYPITGRLIDKYPRVFVEKPTLSSEIQTDEVDIVIPQLSIADFVEGIADSLIIILENQRPKHYGEAGYFSGEVRQFTSRMNRVVKEANGPVKIYHNNSPQIEVIDELSFIGGASRAIVKIENKSILDSDGYLWSLVDQLKKGNDHKWYLNSTIYEPEPNLRFLAIHGNHFDTLYAISEDGRLFTGDLWNNSLNLRTEHPNVIAMTIRKRSDNSLNNLAFLVLKDF